VEEEREEKEMNGSKTEVEVIIMPMGRSGFVNHLFIEDRN
jgi:hypothetical protein